MVEGKYTLAWSASREGDRLRVEFFDLESAWSGWVRWTPDQAREFAARLLEVANEVEEGDGE